MKFSSREELTPPPWHWPYSGSPLQHLPLAEGLCRVTRGKLRWFSGYRGARAEIPMAGALKRALVWPAGTKCWHLTRKQLFHSSPSVVEKPSLPSWDKDVRPSSLREGTGSWLSPGEGQHGALGLSVPAHSSTKSCLALPALLSLPAREEGSSAAVLHNTGDQHISLLKTQTKPMPNIPNVLGI